MWRWEHLGDKEHWKERTKCSVLVSKRMGASHRRKEQMELDRREVGSEKKNKKLRGQCDELAVLRERLKFKPTLPPELEQGMPEVV